MSNKQKTPNCDMHEALVSYLYDEATAEETRRVQAHLTECTACKQELESFERVRGMLQQWQLDDLPVVRVVAERPPSERSMLGVLRELFSLTPAWAKALGAVAMAMLVLSVIGTDVSIGRNGLSIHADLLRHDRTTQPVDDKNTSGTPNVSNLEIVRAEVKTMVNQLIAQSERQQRDEMKAQLVSLETQLQNMHSTDLAKIATRIQEHQQRLKTLEHDIDRREGLDLTDILFSELSRPIDRSTTTGGSD